MYHLATNARRDLVQLSFTEQVGVADAKRCRADVKALLPSLPTGFRLLTDLSHLEEMDFACADEIRAVMDLFAKGGVSHIVRVIPDQRKDIGFSIMSFFHYGSGVSVETVASLADGLKAIER